MNVCRETRVLLKLGLQTTKPLLLNKAQVDRRTLGRSECGICEVC